MISNENEEYTVCNIIFGRKLNDNESQRLVDILIEALDKNLTDDWAANISLKKYDSGVLEDFVKEKDGKKDD